MTFVFEPSDLSAIASRGVGLPRDEMFAAVQSALVERYPEHIRPAERWIYNNAGGAMGAIALMHASLTEYVLFFGTPIGTQGHSGRYATEVHDFVMAGEMWCWEEGGLERRVYRPGDHAVLGRGAAKGYRLPGEAWMLEYARGPIPAMLPFGLVEAFTSTLDGRSLARTIADYGSGAVKSLLKGKI
jgi:C-8 sterol isomerase